MTIFLKLLSRAERARETRSLKQREEATLRNAIEQVVQASSPLICTLKGDCRAVLRDPVASALAYMDQTVTAIPGPFELSAPNWDRDPLLKALFVEPNEIVSLLHHSAKLKSFFSDDRTRQAFGLLTAIKKERTVFGTAVEGGIVRRDVAQTAVEFYDHRMAAVALTEMETRSELKERALNVLVTQVLEKVLKLRSLKDELVEQQRILSIKIKIQQTRNRSLDAMLDPNPEAEPQAEQVLAEIDRRIKGLEEETGSPKENLQHLTQILSTPQEVLTVTPVSLRLNWMGIKQCDGLDECVPEIHLAEVEFKGRSRRVAVLVKVDRQDVLNP